MKRLFLVVCCCVAWGLDADEDRIWVDLTINKDQQVRLAFDTGAPFPVLFRQAAERLKLKLAEPPSETPPASGLATNPATEMCDFAWGGSSGRIQFLVVAPSPFTRLEMDGVLSWYAFRTNVFVFDTTKTSKSLDITGAVPAYALGWPKFQQRTAVPILAFDAHGEDAQHRVIYVDTGDPGGVALNHTLWDKWMAAHAQQPATMRSVESFKAVCIEREAPGGPNRKASAPATAATSAPKTAAPNPAEPPTHPATKPAHRSTGDRAIGWHASAPTSPGSISGTHGRRKRRTSPRPKGPRIRTTAINLTANAAAGVNAARSSYPKGSAVAIMVESTSKQAEARIERITGKSPVGI